MSLVTKYKISHYFNRKVKSKLDDATWDRSVGRLIKKPASTVTHDTYTSLEIKINEIYNEKYIIIDDLKKEFNGNS